MSMKLLIIPELAFFKILLGAVIFLVLSKILVLTTELTESLPFSQYCELFNGY